MLRARASPTLKDKQPTVLLTMICSWGGNFSNPQKCLMGCDLRNQIYREHLQSPGFSQLLCDLLAEVTKRGPFSGATNICWEILLALA
jgi:hypothetical protein